MSQQIISQFLETLPSYLKPKFTLDEQKDLIDKFNEFDISKEKHKAKKVIPSIALIDCYRDKALG